MLAPRASSAFVCIRCELKLARPRLPVLHRQPSHANFSASARRRDVDDETTQTAPKLPSAISAHPLGRLRKRKGKAAVRETTARLEGGVKTLGADAQILVLREVGDAPSKERAAPEVILGTPQEAVDIAESLKQERSLITQQEITKHLESLRPTVDAGPDEPHYVSQSTFVKLSKKLLVGFTGQQLSQYYSVTKGVKRKQVATRVLDGIKELQSRAKRPAERSDWHPGTTQINRRLPGLDVHQRPNRKPVSKHLLVDQILRDLWKLVLLEEIESPGELELSLKPWQLSLLSSGSTQTPLDRIGNKRRAKIEIHWPHNVLRITADKNTAEYTADDIEQLLQNTEAVRFHMMPWAPYLDTNSASGGIRTIFPEKTLNLVATMTDTSVQVAGNNQILIRALDKSSVEEAERCLIRLLPLKESIASTINTTHRDDAKSQSYLLPATVDQSAIDVQSRALALGRWTSPVARTLAPATVPGEATTEAQHHMTEQDSSDQYLNCLRAEVLGLVDKNAVYAEKKTRTNTGEWSIEPEVRLSAEFGHALFLLEDHQGVANSNAKPTSFFPHLPGLTRMLTDEAFIRRNRLGAPALEYTFIAAPQQPNFSKDQEFPTLHMQIRRMEHTGEYMLQKLSLGFDHRQHDVLLPEKAVDIRFRRYSRLRYRGLAADKDFVQTILANIHSGKKLTAPNLELDIPKWTIPGSEDKLGTRTVKYLFTGINFRQSLAGKYMGIDVSYNSMKSGKLGSKGSWLSAYYSSPSVLKGVDTTSHEEDPLRLFVKSCVGIAERATEAMANSVSVVKGKKERNEQGARRMRRRALQAATNDIGDAENLGEVSGQVGAPVVESITGTQRIEDSEVISSAFSSRLNAEDVEEDPFLSNLLAEDTSFGTNSDEPIFVRSEEVDKSPEEEGERELKVAA